MKNPRNETKVNQDAVGKMIAEFDLLGISAREFLDLAGLDRKWIDNARSGKYRSAKAAVARQKFRVALDAVKSSRGILVGGAGKGPAGPVAASGPSPGAEALEKLRELIKKADSPDECIDLQKLMDDMLAAGQMPGESGVATHRALNDSIKERRQLLELRAKQQEQARAGEPIEVRVVYVNSWRPPDGDGREEAPKA